MRILPLVLILLAAAGCDSNDPDPVTCADGDLAVVDVEVGTGQPAQLGRRVTVAYTGRLADGTVFDSNANATFTLDGGVIRGFRDGIGGVDDIAPMKIGGQRTITIPPNQAYGPGGRPGIPSCATLEFDIELLDLP